MNKMTELKLPLWAELVVLLYNTSDNQRYGSKILYKVAMSTSWNKKMLLWLEQNGIIFRDSPNKNRIRYIHFTKKGDEIAKLLLQIKTVLKKESRCNNGN